MRRIHCKLVYDDDVSIIFHIIFSLEHTSVNYLFILLLLR